MTIDLSATSAPNIDDNVASCVAATDTGMMGPATHTPNPESEAAPEPGIKPNRKRKPKPYPELDPDKLRNCTRLVAVDPGRKRLISGVVMCKDTYNATMRKFDDPEAPST